MTSLVSLLTAITVFIRSISSVLVINKYVAYFAFTLPYWVTIDPNGTVRPVLGFLTLTANCASLNLLIGIFIYDIVYLFLNNQILN